MNKGLSRVTFSERSLAAPERAWAALYGQYPTRLVWYCRGRHHDRTARTKTKLKSGIVNCREEGRADLRSRAVTSARAPDRVRRTTKLGRLMMKRHVRS